MGRGNEAPPMEGKMRRYTVTADGNDRATLAINKDCDMGHAGETREFWARPFYYVREERDGLTGLGAAQVCDMLSTVGPTLFRGDEPLVDLIRREARRSMRNEDRRNAKEW